MMVVVVVRGREGEKKKKEEKREAPRKNPKNGKACSCVAVIHNVVYVESKKKKRVHKQNDSKGKKQRLRDVGENGLH